MEEINSIMNEKWDRQPIFGWMQEIKHANLSLNGCMIGKLKSFLHECDSSWESGIRLLESKENKRVLFLFRCLLYSFFCPGDIAVLCYENVFESVYICKSVCVRRVEVCVRQYG